MTVPLDLGINTWIGMTYSLVARGKLDELEAGDSLLATTPYLEGLAFATAVGTGIAGICYRLAPDWMLMYYADHEDIPAGVQAAMFGLYPAMYTLGFMLGHQLEKKKKRLGWAAWAANLAGVLGFILMSLDRLLKVGTKEEYTNNQAKSIFKTALAPILLTGLPAAFPALYFFSKRATS